MNEIERLLTEGFITESFLHEEIRCEYLVSANMKKAWAIQLDLLRKLIEVCQKNNLRIWVSGGTLLGAVRHKGFIPWDDDIDVFLPRSDYDKLLNLPQGEFSYPYFLQSELNEKNLFTPYARIRNSNTYVNENNMRHPEKIDWNEGIFVDIFPLDGVTDNKFKLKFFDKIIRLERKLIHAYVLNASPRWQARLLHIFLHCPFVPFTSIKAIRHIHYLSRNTDYDKASKIGLLICSPYSLEKNIYEKEDWKETEWLPFENIMVPVPIGWDNILKKVFGDYMQYPPKEKRGNWHALVFDAETPYSQIKKG